MKPSHLRWVRGGRFFFALLALLALAVHARQCVFVAHFPPVNFLSFFTVQSNLFALLVLLWNALAAGGRRSSPGRDLFRGAAVLYLSITGIVYGVLLTGQQDALHLTIPWVNTILHRIMPLVMAGDWLIDPPADALTFRRALVWLIYPIVFLGYTFIRGPMVHWYPYPFLDPAQPGDGTVVALYSAGIGLFALFLTWLVVIAGRHLRLIIT